MGADSLALRLAHWYWLMHRVEFSSQEHCIGRLPPGLWDAGRGRWDRGGYQYWQPARGLEALRGERRQGDTWCRSPDDAWRREIYRLSTGLPTTDNDFDAALTRFNIRICLFANKHFALPPYEFEGKYEDNDSLC